jgi:hypothetical protein
VKTELCLNQTIACYDSGGKTADRYTVIYLDQPERAVNTFAAVAMNAEPFHPQGFGQHTTAMPGRHCGKRIAFASLPADCQKLVIQDCTPELDGFTRGYLMAAFWTNDDDAPSGDYAASGRYDAMFAKLHPAEVDKAAADCDKFKTQTVSMPAPNLADAIRGGKYTLEQAGHDFWLTRNHHGSGFWDRDGLPESTSKDLTDAAHAFGEKDIYAGDDGRLYFN